MSDEFNIHPAARDEFYDSIRHYAALDESDRGAGLAFAFESTFHHHLNGLIGSPLLFNLRRGPVRRVNLTPRFGEYYIAYMLWRERVVILAVAHGKRRPWYWRRRISEAKNMF